MKMVILLKALAESQQALEAPSTLILHARRNRKESLENRDHQTLKTLFAIQEAV